MENQTVSNATDNVDVDPSAAEPEEISDSFLCCICLDLLYKPIVLSCGHISCFWCVHKSMSFRRKSQCPICRCTYNHFPYICVLLHRLLLKMYPIAYKMKEKLILEEEKRSGCFSPQFDNHAREPPVDNVIHHLSDSTHSCRTVCESTSTCGSHEKMEQLDSISLAQNNGTTKNFHMAGVTITDRNLCANELSGNFKRISIADALCIACKQLLFHPVVLNCGHVYCETCIIERTDQQLKCEVCQCLNPNGFPKVCLELDHFLEEQFCYEYTLRKEAVHLKVVQLMHENATTCSKGAGESGSTSSAKTDHSSWLIGSRSKVHVGVGCDSCGMCPLIGDRYRCKDCKELKGFDLCGDCYRTQPKLPGRFNQQHTPEHELELVRSSISSSMAMRFRERVEDGSTAVVRADGVFEENGSPTLFDPNYYEFLMDLRSRESSS